MGTQVAECFQISQMSTMYSGLGTIALEITKLSAVAWHLRQTVYFLACKRRLKNNIEKSWKQYLFYLPIKRGYFCILMLKYTLAHLKMFLQSFIFIYHQIFVCLELYLAMLRVYSGLYAGRSIYGAGNWIEISSVKTNLSTVSWIYLSSCSI